jgi:cellulose synthase/poly-beta-1,6-N-acetylglucosamine synthase-like glycosyltransferase
MNVPLIYDIFRYGHLILFAGLQTVLMFGIFREWLKDRRSMSAPFPEGADVSVIIPIHNESGRISGLLASLLEQDYPAEIIFIDDRSDDEGPAMLAQFLHDAGCRGMKNCRIITLKENPGPNYKQYALGRGIAESTGDFLLFTDGDCEVPPGWIRAMTQRMADDSTGAVIGPVFKKMQGNSFFSLYQCFDHIVRYNYLVGAIGLGAAGGGFGNNLIVNKKALDEVGGYDAVPPSPTEDAALISLIRTHGKYTIRAVCLTGAPPAGKRRLHPDAAVTTVAECSWKALVSQTLRWNNGGIYSPDFVTRINYNFLMLVISTSIIAILMIPIFPGLWLLPLGTLIGMTENTAAALLLFRSNLPAGGILLGIRYVFCALFMPVYLTLMTLMSYLRIKIKWKDNDVV